MHDLTKHVAPDMELNVKFSPCTSCNKAHQHNCQDSIATGTQVVYSTASDGLRLGTYSVNFTSKLENITRVYLQIKLQQAAEPLQDASFQIHVMLFLEELLQQKLQQLWYLRGKIGLPI